jgi:hypothetical protein
MPGIGELMDGAVQQAPQAGRQFMPVMLAPAPPCALLQGLSP